MCGIAGYVGDFERDVLARMSGAIAHRGPDDDGVWFGGDGAVGLAHRRLSIIDLTAAGHQPMLDVNDRAVIVFNGEIYNYLELRSELEHSGCQFRGHSDTEVLLNLYLRDGAAFLERLNGIFALALWDLSRRILLVARDGAGVKPLYWTRTRGGFAFGSEIKALVALPGLDRTVDPETVAAHLGLLYAPGPRTMLREVRKLLPGRAMELDHRGDLLREWAHYTMPWGPDDACMSLEEAKSGLIERIDQAVHRQLVADVEVGAFLSGGLDSSTLVHFARQHISDDSPPPCFTIDLLGASEDAFTDDLPYARRVAAHIGVPLHEIQVDASSLMDLDEMVFHLDEPQPDPAALNVLYIATLARAQGIKVLLSGAGGDDVLTGYRRHRALKLERYWAWMPPVFRSALRIASSRLSVGHPSLRRLTKMFGHADLPLDERLGAYFLWIDDQRVRALLDPDFSRALDLRSNLEIIVDEIDALPAQASPLAKMLHLDRRFFLPDHNLNYTDKLSMAVGVEVRTPFLDPDVIDFAVRIPERFRQRGKEGKWVLKEAMLPHLPRDVVYRPKTGFGAPLRRWIHADLRPRFDEYLTSTRIRDQGIFESTAVRQLLAADAAGQIDAAYPLFAVLCVDSWCRQFLA